MERGKLKEWSKSKIKGNTIKIFLVILLVSIITSLTIGTQVDWNNLKFEGGQLKGYKPGFNFGFLFYFVNVGFAYYMVKFVEGKENNISDIFYFIKDFFRTLITGLIKGLFIALWSLLLIVPGIIKTYAYALIELLLADEEYEDLSATEAIKLSQEMMKGHKMDLFVLDLSFIGWHLLAILTLGILEIWILPYHMTARVKFLNDVKKEYEKKNK